MAQLPQQRRQAGGKTKEMVKYKTGTDIKIRYLIITKYYEDEDTMEAIADNLDVAIGTVAK